MSLFSGINWKSSDRYHPEFKNFEICEMLILYRAKRKQTGLKGNKKDWDKIKRNMIKINKMNKKEKEKERKKERKKEKRY